MRVQRLCVLSTVLCGFAASSFAADVYVPDALKPWVDWVLAGEERRRCPFLTTRDAGRRDTHVCAWPGRLDLEVTAGGAQFSQSWDVVQRSWVELPGDPLYWPRDVRLDGGAAGVVERNGRPVIELRPGRHRLSGRFEWARRPPQLPVPTSTGLVSLTVDGKPVMRPSRDGESLWLGERGPGAQEEERLDVRVYRRLEDGIPFLVETRILLDVGGPAREEVLPHAVPEGFAGMALAGELTARVDPDGSLRVQVRPGRWELTLRTRARTVPESLTPQPVGAAEEIWSYQSSNRLRVTALEGADAVDPSQAGVPGEWESLPAFRVTPAQPVRIVVREAGGPEANQLALRREMWLDFDGDGLTARDQVTGRMRQDWRLDLQAPFRMEGARVGGQNLLVTEGAAAGLSGVELREPQLELEVIARLSDGGGSAPATGYTERFGEVNALLHLPPAHRLLWAGGADRAPEAWLNRWTLLDLFLLLLIAVGTGRLISPLAGGIAGAALLLIYHEAGAPVWSWVNLLAAVALARVAPEGRLRRSALLYRALSLAVLLVVLVPFIATQARLVIHPQLEQPSPTPVQFAPPASEAPAEMEMGRAGATRELAAPEADMVMAKEEAAGAPQARAPRVVRFTTAKPTVTSMDLLPPGTVLQTGPGIPAWGWHRYELGWSGPVEPADELSLWILGPFSVALARLLGIGFAVALLYLLVRGDLPAGWQRFLRPGATAAMLAAVLVAGLPPPLAAADMPSPTLLEELKRRLTQPPECAPACAVMEHALVRAEGERLTARLTVHAQAAVAVPVPGAGDGWQPDTLLAGGGRAIIGTGGEETIAQPAGAELAAFRDDAGQLWVPLSPGVHVITVAGRLTRLDTLSLPFPLPPRSITVVTSGWVAGGVTEGRLPSGALELARLRQAAAAPGSGAATGFPAFAEVRRFVVLGLEFSVRTTVTRLAPESQGFTMPVDLLPGESVTTPGVEVRDGKALVAMGAGENEVDWQSVLPRADSVTLAAARDRPWREIWLVGASPMWHVGYEGLQPVVPEDPEAAATPEFWPREGDQLTLTLNRPAAVEGATLALDAVRLTVNTGQRARDVDLSFPYRSTRGGQHVLRLPPGAELQSLTVDGESVPARPRDGVLDLPVLPGGHQVAMQWRESERIRAWHRTAPVDLGSRAANLNLQVRLPEDRWVLFAAGPGVGPAILYWSELAVFIVAALLLGRTGWTPLATREWLLLGLGFSTFSWALLLLVAAWFFVLRWRGTTRTAFRRNWPFNLLQVALALLTVIAVGALISGIPQALLGRPDMHIAGAGSSGNQLQWFTDQTDGPIPQTTVFAVHLWWYKGAMLAWALWITFAFTRWLPWAWANFSKDGLWRGRIARLQE